MMPNQVSIWLIHDEPTGNQSDPRLTCGVSVLVSGV
jgi:hypothetical protein